MTYEFTEVSITTGETDRRRTAEANGTGCNRTAINPNQNVLLEITFRKKEDLRGCTRSETNAHNIDVRT
jgi:hypothetical protein